MEDAKEKAVALRYESGFPAPMVISKGKGELAKKIIEIAKENSITLVEDKELTERLFYIDTENWIPEDLYEIIAGIYAFISEVQAKK